MDGGISRIDETHEETISYAQGTNDLIRLRRPFTQAISSFEFKSV